MASRLDRLVTLLETGSTNLIRTTAAQQLADVQKQHPDELFNLLTRVLPFLRSAKWDTRVAAAKAIGGIVDHAPRFDPNEDDGFLKDENPTDIPIEGRPVPKADQLQLDNLRIGEILKYGKVLLGSAGKEYDYALAALDPADRLAKQKQSLTARLGLAGEYIEQPLIDERDFATTPQNGSFPHPLTLHKINTNPSPLSRKNSIQSPLPLSAMSPRGFESQNGSEESGLSKRQLNALKRKHKASIKQQAGKIRIIDLAAPRALGDVPETPITPSLPSAVSELKKEDSSDRTNDFFTLDRKNVDEDEKFVSEFKGQVAPVVSTIQTEAEEQGLEWPFERLCDILAVDLFDHNWEVRHGAAMGLREVIRVHGKGAGRLQGKPRWINDAANAIWLDDLACRYCCVLMLDRFGDYVSDTVVAPVRETVGQALATLLLHLQPQGFHAVYNVLWTMVHSPGQNSGFRTWEVCHGGMIGLKYLAAVRADLLRGDPRMIWGVVDSVKLGLTDADDDVRAVSAATMIPLAEDFVASQPDQVQGFMTILWECLSDLRDDLSASTGHVMDLLARLCNIPTVLQAMMNNANEDAQQSFGNLVPRLYPFLRHTIPTVRNAVLGALRTFLRPDTKPHEWIDGKLLRLLFQNLFVEKNEDILKSSLDVWYALTGYLASSGAFSALFLPHFKDLLDLTLHPIGVSRYPLLVNLSLIMRPSGQMYVVANPIRKSTPPLKGAEPQVKRRKRSKKEEEPPPTTHNVDGHMLQGDVDLVGLETLIRSRIYCARALGSALSICLRESPASALMEQVSTSFSSTYSTTQMTACMICEEVALYSGSERSELPPSVLENLRAIIQTERPGSYSDLTSFLTIARAQCHSLINAFRDQAHVAQNKLPSIAVVVQGEPGAGPSAFSIADADKIANDDFERLKKGLNPMNRVTSLKFLTESRDNALIAIEEAKRVKLERDTRIKATAAGAMVALLDIPKKPSQLIKGLMDSIKTEQNVELQNRSASSVAALLKHYSKSSKGPADKIIANLVKFYCIDTSDTPEFFPNIVFKDAILSLRKEEDRRDHPDAAKYEAEARQARITRRGAKEALERTNGVFGNALFTSMPTLHAKIVSPLQTVFSGDWPEDLEDENTTLGQDTVDALSILRVLMPTLHEDLYAVVDNVIDYVLQALVCKYAVFRYAAAKCFAQICDTMRNKGMQLLVEKVLPRMGNPLDLQVRQGAIECIYHLLHLLDDQILPYVVFLIVPILGRMSDSDGDVRLIATTTFATLVKLVPLEAGIPDPPGFSEELLKGRDRERKFIAQMLDPKKSESFEIPVAIKAELRSYQQEGVNWLAFLNRFNLHGVLCDDMGLGKTLQTLCIVASDHHLRAEEYAKSNDPIVRRLPSLIVCPPTLSGHWQQEIQTYAPFLTSLAFVGPPQERSKLRNQLGSTDIVITSYDILRNDIDAFLSMSWNYCVLDEGHLIKNPRTKTTIAVKRVSSNHRLILSGTPIQNNVLELWSLFDFLMPGFLGSEKLFQDRFSKPIAASRNAKSSSKEQERGALAIESLHKQVLPFLLRRLKEEVLDDLPPKILQNYYCDPSELQKQIYQDFQKKESKSIQEKAAAGDKEAKQHIFQALQYMRKVCNSPALVIKEGHKQFAAITRQLAEKGQKITDISHAPKLTALKDLLLDCGIGSPAPTDESQIQDALFVSQHRALIFFQMKEMLEMVQTEVLAKLLPSVQYLRLDGNVEASRRQAIVNQFNSDPSYDVLLLTTSVGGLGLNLTGADTVIFVEHDWNPQKDLQAMDRAHRIGQKKVVNVYRLITRGTVEEKILGLQRFKIDVASTVVNQQNAGLGSMQTDQILDLFNVDESAMDGGGGGGGGGGGKNVMGNEEDAIDEATGEVREKGKKGWLDDLGELSDERQYEDEFNLDGFLKTMK
ncbi:TATA-binding protein-associated factor mot1 [Agyrium rufum]|nr:TATA-binding protein-associated factor mot1 [Agyrium rufum]